MGADLTIVVPAFNAAGLLPALLRDAAGLSVIVVDDASTDATATVAAELGATVVRRDKNAGPAAARNAGWRAATTAFVVFVDADASIPQGIDAALTAFRDPKVALVAPRIAPRLGPSPNDVARYDAATSVYDLGEQPGEIGPDEPIRYLTSAVVFARRAALEAVDGFDPELRFGEDLDLLLRVRAAGWRGVYEPHATATHGVRDGLRELLSLHYRYSVPHGTLSRRHKQNRGIGRVTLHPSGWVASARTALAAITGPWFVLVLVSLAFAPGPWPAYFGALLALAVLRHTLEWRQARPDVALPAWVGLRFLDNEAKAVGLLWGCVRAGTLAPMLPRVAWRRP